MLQHFISLRIQRYQTRLNMRISNITVVTVNLKKEVVRKGQITGNSLVRFIHNVDKGAILIILVMHLNSIMELVYAKFGKEPL